MKKNYISAVIASVVVVTLLIGASVLLKMSHNEYVYSSYPLKYREEVEAASKKYGVDKYLIYAVIKTESNFDPKAESHAGAVGLMQLMPKTFEWLQTYYVNEDYENYTFDDMKTPGLNIEYGANLLSVLLDMYESEDTALCAYNAGVGNVDKWLEDSSYSDDGKTFKYVPISETENYRHLVAQNKSCYKRLYENN